MIPNGHMYCTLPVHLASGCLSFPKGASSSRSERLEVFDRAAAQFQRRSSLENRISCLPAGHQAMHPQGETLH